MSDLDFSILPPDKEIPGDTKKVSDAENNAPDEFDLRAFFSGEESTEEAQTALVPPVPTPQPILPPEPAAEISPQGPVILPIDERDLPPEWKTIFTSTEESAPTQTARTVESAEEPLLDDNLADRWNMALGTETHTTPREEQTFSTEVVGETKEEIASPFLESWDIFSPRTSGSSPAEEIEAFKLEQTDVVAVEPAINLEPYSEGILPASELKITEESPTMTGETSLEDLLPETLPSELTPEPVRDSYQEAGPQSEMVSLSADEIPDFYMPISESAAQKTDKADWQSFFGQEGEPVQFESAPGVEPTQPENVPGQGIKISYWDRLRQSLHLTRSEWIAIAAVAALAILSLGTLFFIRVLMPLMQVKPTPIVPTATIVQTSAIYPIRVEFGGGIKIDLTRGTTVDGKWEPKTAEWLVGSEVRKVIAIPSSKELLAIVQALSAGDKITIHMNNATTLIYKVAEVKEIDRNQADIMTDTRPSVVIILFQADTDKRWVIIARQ